MDGTFAILMVFFFIMILQDALVYLWILYDFLRVFTILYDLLWYFMIIIWFGMILCDSMMPWDSLRFPMILKYYLLLSLYIRIRYAFHMFSNILYDSLWSDWIRLQFIVFLWFLIIIHYTCDPFLLFVFLELLIIHWHL